MNNVAIGRYTSGNINISDVLCIFSNTLNYSIERRSQSELLHGRLVVLIDKQIIEIVCRQVDHYAQDKCERICLAEPKHLLWIV